MTILLNTKFFLSIYLFLILRLVDSDMYFKGIIFIIISLTLIYIDQKKFSKFLTIILLLLSMLFFFINEKKDIIEISSPIKLSEETNEEYLDYFGEEKFKWIKNNFLIYANNCYKDLKYCFYEKKINNFIISPDQIIFSLDRSYSRKINQINFNSLADGRMPFINPSLGNIKFRNIDKLDTPYFVNYKNLNNLSEICFKGLAYINFHNNHEKYYNVEEELCVKEKIKSFLGLNLPGNNLSVYSINNNTLDNFNDELILILFLFLVIFNINRDNLKSDLKVFLPTTISIFIIFFISRYDSWFEIFNLFSFYFFGFEGGDGRAYLDHANVLFQSFINLNFLEFLRAGEDTFYYTPGLRYFLFINQLISGDFYYFYFFLLFFLPKILLSFLKIFFDKKISYFIFLSFLLVPIFHHLGFSYYQYIRHAYRLFPESLGYMFFISALTLFFKNYHEKYLKMNILFALSVFLRPNLILSVILIFLIKIIKEKINIFKNNYFLILLLVSMIYFFPLMHNIYFGSSFTLFTDYGSKILSLDNILSKDVDFYLERFISINSIFMLLLFLPSVNVYLKCVLLTQYLTVFWFDLNGRYYWIFWLISLVLILELLQNKIKKWKFQKKSILN